MNKAKRSRQEVIYAAVQSKVIDYINEPLRDNLKFSINF